MREENIEPGMQLDGEWQKPTLQVLLAEEAEFGGVLGVDAPTVSNFS